jgi:hypothetical protein
MSQQSKRKFGLRQEILVNFVVLSLIALGSLAIMAAIFNSIIGSSITGASAEQQQEIAANNSASYNLYIVMGNYRD